MKVRMSKDGLEREYGNEDEGYYECEFYFATSTLVSCGSLKYFFARHSLTLVDIGHSNFLRSTLVNVRCGSLEYFVLDTRRRLKLRDFVAIRIM